MAKRMKCSRVYALFHFFHQSSFASHSLCRNAPLCSTSSYSFRRSLATLFVSACFGAWRDNGFSPAITSYPFRRFSIAAFAFYFFSKLSSILPFPKCGAYTVIVDESTYKHRSKLVALSCITVAVSQCSQSNNITAHLI